MRKHKRSISEIAVVCLLTSFMFGLSACSLLERRRAQSNDEMENESSVPQKQTRRLTDAEARILAMQSQIRRLERDLRSDEERRQYQASRIRFKSLQDQIEFLTLKDSYTRERWLASQEEDPIQSQFNQQVSQLIALGDIALGLPKEAVLQSWGKPKLVEYSGNPQLGNEKWHYTEWVAKNGEYREQKRFVVFEAGRVAGWKTN
jgi:hypothetical protein